MQLDRIPLLLTLPPWLPSALVASRLPRPSGTGVSPSGLISPNWSLFQASQGTSAT